VKGKTPRNIALERGYDEVVRAIEEFTEKMRQRVKPVAWPSNTDYEEAMHNPTACLTDPELKSAFQLGRAKVITRVIGGVSYTTWSSGNVATVFKIEVDRIPYIIRCFYNSSIGDLEGRYDEITEYLKYVRERSKSPYLVYFEFVENGITIIKDGKPNNYPIIKMEFVDGVTIGKWIEEKVKVGDRRAIREMADKFLECTRFLKKYGIAHGDLSHANIMIDKNGNIRLIDYDGMFVPAFKNQRAPELGHSSYQHPRRDPSFYNEKLDNFSILVIYLSLLAIADDPSLWEKYNNENNLIFTEEDFKDPNNSVLLQSLKRSKNPRISRLAALLEESCKKEDPNEVVDIRDLLGSTGEAGASAPTPQQPPTEAAADRLEELKRLLNAGAITLKEYEEEKRRLLGS
jgi:serine/threonine protein kinase